jgi:hypothetical protein
MATTIMHIWSTITKSKTWEIRLLKILRISYGILTCDFRQMLEKIIYCKKYSITRKCDRKVGRKFNMMVKEKKRQFKYGDMLQIYFLFSLLLVFGNFL